MKKRLLSLILICMLIISSGTIFAESTTIKTSPVNLTYASPEEIKHIDLEKWYGLMVFGEVEVHEGNIKHEKMITEENTMNVEELKNIYSNEELYIMIESNLYQTIEDQKNGASIIWNKDVVENHIKYEFPDIYKEIIENNLLEVDYTFLLDNKSENQLMDAGSMNYTFSVLFKDSLFLKMIKVNSFLTWKYDENHKLTSVTADDYVNVYGYWADLGINASTNTYSYDKKTCTHYTEAKTRHEPVIGPDGSIIYPWIKMELTGTYGKLLDSGVN